MLKNTEHKYQKLSNTSREWGGQRKVEKAKKQKEKCSDKDNPAIETRKSRSSGHNVHTHMVWQKNRLKERGFS